MKMFEIRIKQQNKEIKRLKTPLETKACEKLPAQCKKLQAELDKIKKDLSDEQRHKKAYIRKITDIRNQDPSLNDCEALMKRAASLAAQGIRGLNRKGKEFYKKKYEELGKKVKKNQQIPAAASLKPTQPPPT